MGKALHGYSQHFEKVAVLRERRVESPIIDNCKRAVIRHITTSVGSAEAVSCAGSYALSVASYGGCRNMLGKRVNLRKCGSLDILDMTNLNIAEYG